MKCQMMHLVDVPKIVGNSLCECEAGDEIKSATEGFVDAFPQIDNYEFTGVTKLNDGKDVQIARIPFVGTWSAKRSAAVEVLSCK